MAADPAAPRARFLRSGLALLAPALLLGAALGWYLRPVPWTRTAWVEGQDKLVATHDPDVVVLGSSWSLTNIDDKALAASLNLPTEKVLKLGQARSEPATW